MVASWRRKQKRAVTWQPFNPPPITYHDLWPGIVARMDPSYPWTTRGIHEYINTSRIQLGLPPMPDQPVISAHYDDVTRKTIFVVRGTASGVQTTLDFTKTEYAPGGIQHQMRKKINIESLAQIIWDPVNSGERLVRAKLLRAVITAPPAPCKRGPVGGLSLTETCQCGHANMVHDQDGCVLCFVRHVKTTV